MKPIEDFINKIHCSDCIELIREIPDDSIDLVVTSPPYYAYKDYGKEDGQIENLESYEEYLNKMNILFQMLFEIVKTDGRICLIVDDKHTNLKTEGRNINRGTHAHFIKMMLDAGFQYKDLIILSKARAGHASGGSNYMLGSYPYPPNIPFVNWFEYILIFRKDGNSRVNHVSKENKEKSKLSFNEFKWASCSIWNISAERNRSHPAPFPIEIPYRLIKLFSFVDDIVLDPFLGSGTTAVACKQLNRNFIGIEINPAYCKMAEIRLKNVPEKLEKWL